MAKVCHELIGLVGPFTRIARAMSAEWGVRIVPSGSRCDTDGEMIRIPFTSDYLPSEMRQVLHGLLDHEVCHVAEERRHRKMSRATPMDVLRDETDKRVQLLLNVVEDVRIEKYYSKRYIGVAENLAALNLEASKDCAAREGWWKRFSAALIVSAHGLDVSWAEEDLGAYLEAVEPELRQMRDGVGPWVDASLDVARRIFDKVKHVHEQQKERAKSEEGTEEGAEESTEEGAEESAEESGPSPDDDVDNPDVLEATRAGLEQYVIHDAVSNKRYIPHPKAHALDAIEVVDENLSTYVAARAEVLPQIRALRQKQRALVSSWTRRKVRPGLQRGDVDEHVLAGARVGETDLFAELTRKLLLNTAITGLVDLSGSMGGNRAPGNGAYYALRTAIALAESWSALRISNEWLGFTAQDVVDTGIVPADLDGPFFCRPPTLHLVIKAFDESMRTARARFGGIYGRGSNIDGEAVLWAWQRLIVRREKRKILVVINDGRPASWNSCLDQQEYADEVALQSHLRDAVRMATKSGIEVIGIGAGTDSPRAFYNKDTGAKFVHVRTISTLAVDVFKVMKQRITRFA